MATRWTMVALLGLSSLSGCTASSTGERAYDGDGSSIDPSTGDPGDDDGSAPGDDEVDDGDADGDGSGGTDGDDGRPVTTADASVLDDAGGSTSPLDGSMPDPGTGPAPTLPTPVGTCPTFTAGTLDFAPQGGAREARIWIDTDAAERADGPIVFYWYGTGGSPNEAVDAFGMANITAITSQGGIVVAPVHSNGGTFPWLGGGDADYRLTDEIIGCAQQEVGIDARRIHSFGFSAGGLFTTALSYARSSYFASVGAYSGGGSGTFADASNKFAVIAFHGGSSDNVFGQDFQGSTNTWMSSLRSADHFALSCNHGGGHRRPSGGGDAIARFFEDHPFGASSPYASGSLPSVIPSYCEID